MKGTRSLTTIMYKLLGLFAFVTIVAANDVIVGLGDEGRKIFDKNEVAAPALWRQINNVTINVSDSEVISRVVVTDLRPGKDGEAKIVEGGDGHRNVTIELKSPTILRGYDFHIVVYAVPDNVQQESTTKQSNLEPTTKINAAKVPVSPSSDPLEENLRKTRKTEYGQSSTTITSLDSSTASPTEPSFTQSGRDQEIPKLYVVKHSRGETDNIPITTEKNVKLPEHVSTTQKTIDSEVTVTNAAPVNPIQKTEVTKYDQNNTEVDELKPVVPLVKDIDVNDDTQLKVIKSDVPAVDQKDHITVVTGSAERVSSTESVKVSSTIKADQSTSQTPTTSKVTVADTFESQDVQTDLSIPRKVGSGKYEQPIPLPYKH